MKTKYLYFLSKQVLVGCFIFLFVFNPTNSWAVVCDGNLNSCNNEKADEKISCLAEKVRVCNETGATLSNEINRFSAQISLTETKITDTEQKIDRTQKEIDTLGSRIEGLDASLNYLTKLLLEKVVQSYKNRSLSMIDFLLEKNNANDFFSSLKYLKTTQNNNQKIVVQVQQAKLNFEEQKLLREEKIKELDSLKNLLVVQKQDLNNQKAAQQKLLADTQNSESIYQNLLEQAKAEYAAIQGIIAGAGTETQLREVKKGDTIASIIPGASCNSSGGHLHLIFQENGAVNNPFNYLKSVDSRNCSSSSCGSGDGDPFNPSGTYDWPISPTIELEQGYGNTWAVRNTWVGRIYSFHNGIDINGSSNVVTAISDGVLYKGAYNVGCTLSYVRLAHKDSNINTLYLHVYPQ